MTAWLHVVGIGEDGRCGLGARARAALGAAEVLVGGARHLAMLPEDGRERRTWPTPFADAIAMLKDLKPRTVAVLASGDPMWFGVGATLAAAIPPAEMEVIPAPSAFALAAARLGWPLAEVACLSLHGRPAAALMPHIASGARLLILAEDRHTPAAVATRLLARGYGPSRIAVLERLGGPGERVTEITADDLARDAGFAPADLNTIAVECRPGPAPLVLPTVPGLPDDAFVQDGRITKREVRAATLARLMPLPGALLWDIGAGSGAVAIEWLRAAPRTRAVAIEPRPDRLEAVGRNAETLGVPHLAIVAGKAPEALAGLPAPDAVFVGGGLSGPGGAAILEAAHAALVPGGRLVANGVTLETEAVLLGARDRFGGELIRLSIARAEPVGPHLGWRPMMPVTQWAVRLAWEPRS